MAQTMGADASLEKIEARFEDWKGIIGPDICESRTCLNSSCLSSQETQLESSCMHSHQRPLKPRALHPEVARTSLSSSPLPIKLCFPQLLFLLHQNVVSRGSATHFLRIPKSVEMPDTGPLPTPDPSSPTSMLTLAFLAWLLLSVLPYILDAASDLELDTPYWVSVCGAVAVGYGLGLCNGTQEDSPARVRQRYAAPVHLRKEPRTTDAMTQTGSEYKTTTSLSDASRTGGGGRSDAATQTEGACQLGRGNDGRAGKTLAEPARRAAKHTLASDPWFAPIKRQRHLQDQIYSRQWMLLQWQKEQAERVAARLRSRLLDLPSELRNQIWRLVLLSPQPLPVVTQVGPLVKPGLLSTSQSVREEATGIFYLENTFHVDMVDFDSRIWTLWTKSSPYFARKTTQLLIVPSTKWRNLRQWLKNVFEGKAFGFRPCEAKDEPNTRGQFSGLLFKVLEREKAKRRSWEEVQVLLGFREVAGMFDAQ